MKLLNKICPDVLETWVRNDIYIRFVNLWNYDFSRCYGISLDIDDAGWEFQMGFGSHALRIGRD